MFRLTGHGHVNSRTNPGRPAGSLKVLRETTKPYQRHSMRHYLLEASAHPQVVQKDTQNTGFTFLDMKGNHAFSRT